MRKPAKTLNAEKVAYWYFRLNGFLQIENFVVHPARRGSARTDADLVGVRFKHRAEFAFDADEAMADDAHLELRTDLNEVVIVEVKTNQPCTLNGPWKHQEQANVERVLAAIGCVSMRDIPNAASRIYSQGAAEAGEFRIRLIAVGRDKCAVLALDFPRVTQLTWDEIIPFLWDRFHIYRNQKQQVDQWDSTGKSLRASASRSTRDEFVRETRQRMGISNQS